MRLSITPGSAQVGNVTIHEVSRVVELDAGNVVPSLTILSDSPTSTNEQRIVSFSHDSLHAIETQLAIIIPCMNEEQNILEGVLRGVPHECLIILVSNSNNANFNAECSMLEKFCTEAQRPGVAVHQQDTGLARAFFDAGMPDIVVEINRHNEKCRRVLNIRNGKGEAMMIGTVIAKLAGKQFVGFIDADNFVPGAVHEYCKVFAAGLYHVLSSKSNRHSSITKPHAMVRIKWKSKPKIEGGKLVIKNAGRCSRVVNEWMNRLSNALAAESVENHLIQTANAGEHAMSIELALELCFATGYAVEPFQLINAWERSEPSTLLNEQHITIRDDDQFSLAASSRCSSVSIHGECDSSELDQTPVSSPPLSRFASGTSSSHLRNAPLSRNVQILQIETCNPHIHDFSKGGEHIQRMQVQGLSTIYHSSLTPQGLKDELQEYMKKELSAFVDAKGEPQAFRVYPPIQTMDFEVFRSRLKVNAGTLKVFGDRAGWAFWH
jgi:mannosyl-3-phosphoglycerate synthase